MDCASAQSIQVAAYALQTPIISTMAPIDSTTAFGSMLGLSNTQQFGTPTRGCWYAPAPPPPTQTPSPPQGGNNTVQPTTQFMQAGLNTRIRRSCETSVIDTYATSAWVPFDPQAPVRVANDLGSYRWSFGQDTVAASKSC
jgi:hypothetical protein